MEVRLGPNHRPNRNATTLDHRMVWEEVLAGALLLAIHPPLLARLLRTIDPAKGQAGVRRGSPHNEKSEDFLSKMTNLQ